MNGHLYYLNILKAQYHIHLRLYYNLILPLLPFSPNLEIREFLFHHVLALNEKL